MYQLILSPILSIKNRGKYFELNEHFSVFLNMYLIRSFLIFIIILPGILHAQTSRTTIEITGEIRDAETGEPVPYVHIINENSGMGTVSKENGRFLMKMEKTDTLTFSAIGFEQYLFTLREDISSPKIDVFIEMNTSTLELKPVKVFAYKDEESLKQALLEMEVTATDDKNRIELPGFYYGPKKPYKPSAFGSPISFIANKFSKEVKEMKKLEQAKVEEDYRKMIKAKYNESVVMELTGLPKEEVREFMEFCKIEESFVARSGPYEIALAVSNCMKKYTEEK